jgi:2,3-bisphosphoglycerate-dependent phosphoglycerate mutase
MPTVWFIRHAESEANAGLPTDNPATIRLTPRGFEQAEDIAQSFTRPPDLIITSSYLRTQQTAKPTLARFPSVPHENWSVEEFTYLALDGVTTFNERRPKVEDFWTRLEPAFDNGKGTESFIQFITRVQGVWYELRSSKKEFIAVFSHEQFIRAVVWLLLNNKMETDPGLCPDCKERFRSFLKSSPMPNGAITPVLLQEDHEARIGGMITSHLKGVTVHV